MGNLYSKDCVGGEGSHKSTAPRVTPFLQVVTSAKDAVANSVTGVVDLARRGRRWSGELRRSMSQAMDMVLVKSEELVDHFLPMTEDELGTNQKGLARACLRLHSTAQGEPGLTPRLALSLLSAPQKTWHLNPKETGGFRMGQTSHKLVPLETAGC